MDPQQTAVYAKAHAELRDLFHEIARHGRVTAYELQHALLPFTAGDARRDLQELVEEMKRRQLSLDEPEFIRALWKKMYLTNVIYTTQQTGVKPRPASAGSGSSRDEQAINIPLTHVIVSIKRRAQLHQFANYYASRGISGADHLGTTSETSHTDRSTPRHVLQAQRKRQAAAMAAAQAASVVALRARTSSCYDVIICYYDTETQRMKVNQLIANAEAAVVANCSRLQCILTTETTGPLTIASRHFVAQVRARARQLAAESDQAIDAGDSPSWGGNVAAPGTQVKTIDVASNVASHLVFTKFDDVGLRNIVALGVGRGTVVAATERRVHYWKALDRQTTVAIGETPTTTADSLPNATPGVPLEVVEFLEDEGDCFGHVPLLKRSKTVCEQAAVKQIACGDGFAVGVNAASELFVWGASALGRGKASPTRVSLPVDATVSRVVCGLHHVLLLTTHGSVFAWGSNVHGQLGLHAQGSALDAGVTEPTEVKLPSIAVDVACGDRHSVVLTDKGSLFAWGNNWHGQLGLDTTASETGSIFVPTKVTWWVHRTTEFSASHANGDEEPASPERRGSQAASPHKRDAPPRAYLCTASGDTTAIVTDNGQVFQWGKCVPMDPSAGVCGLVETWKPQRIDRLDELLVDDRQQTRTDAGGSPWAGIAIASGLVLLTKHLSAG